MSLAEQDKVCASEIARLFEKMDDITKAYIMGYSQGVYEKALNSTVNNQNVPKNAKK